LVPLVSTTRPEFKVTVDEEKVMGLKSNLFKGDPALEACLVRDVAHITVGCHGEHVSKIQIALATLDGATIDSGEIAAKRYGSSTAAAVLAYKKKRNIINRSYQTQADNIVGKMTIASLDDEMQKLEAVPRGPVRIVPRSHWTMRPVSYVVASFGATGKTFGTNAFVELTMPPGSIGIFDVVDGSPGSIAIEDPGIAKIKPSGKQVASGDRFAVTENRQSFQVLSGPKPGTTRITATTATSAASLNVAVNPARPILYLDHSWKYAERIKITAALQQLTRDEIYWKGDEVFVDPSHPHGVAPNLDVGTALLRGLQHPAGKVTIVPLTTGGIVSSTDWSGNGAIVNLAVTSGGDFRLLDLFVSTGAGKVAVEKCPGFILVGHELVHAYRMLRGHGRTAGGPSRDHEFFDPSGSKFIERVYLEELIVMGIDGSEPISENRIRAEHGLSSREAYASPDEPLDTQNVRPAGATPSWWPNCPH
jgi:hypothetical protein